MDKAVEWSGDDFRLIRFARVLASPLPLAGEAPTPALARASSARLGPASGRGSTPSPCLQLNLISSCSQFPDSIFEDQIRLRIPAARFARVVLDHFAHEIRGRRERRVPVAPAVSCARLHKGSAHEHTGTDGAIRRSLRNGFTAYAALSPATNSFCHRRLRIDGDLTRLGRSRLRKLDTSNGCQDHTVLPYAAPPPKASTGDVPIRRSRGEGEKRRSSSARRSLTGDPPCNQTGAPGAAASTAFHPASVTIAIRPSFGTERIADRTESTGW
jgi:hypothetical protein